MELEILVLACAAAGIALAVRAERARWAGPVSWRGLDRAAEYGAWLAAAALAVAGLVRDNVPAPVLHRWAVLALLERAHGSSRTVVTVVPSASSGPWAVVTFTGSSAAAVHAGVFRIAHVLVSHPGSGVLAVRSAVSLSGWALWTDILVPQALLLAVIVAGLARRRSRSGRWPVIRRPLVAGTAPWRWALLLVPVLAIACELFGLGWAPGADRLTVTTLGVVLALGLAVALVAPAIAADLAAAGLTVLGVYGLGLAVLWPVHSLVPGAYWPDALYGAAAVDSRGWAMLAGAQGLLLLGFGGWLAPRTIGAHVTALRSPADAELTRRVQRLTESRAVAVDSAASHLRRLERDLHDGAQARLVALGMSLRAAERLIPVNPDAAIALVAEAREISARALTELRELVRGVHPPVLADRGLADAVRALALDSPVTVETDIDLPCRLPAPIETACYFAVAEVLTNVAKHSSAREARIAMSHSGGRLRIEVTDFGLGGADPGRGTGLAGVERRLATFDGILAVSSPVGGPTMVVMEVPCALSLPRTSSC